MKEQQIPEMAQTTGDDVIFVPSIESLISGAKDNTANALSDTNSVPKRKATDKEIAEMLVNEEMNLNGDERCEICGAPSFVTVPTNDGKTVKLCRDCYRRVVVDHKKRHTPVKRQEPKTGRNELCPCGSGKKYKKYCYGK